MQDVHRARIFNEKANSTRSNQFLHAIDNIYQVMIMTMMKMNMKMSMMMMMMMKREEDEDDNDDDGAADEDDDANTYDKDDVFEVAYKHEYDDENDQAE